MKPVPLRLILLCLVLWLPPLCAQTPDDWAGVRAEFSAAITRAAAGETAQADSTALRGYVLYPYVLAARLQQQLKSAPGPATDAAVDAYLKQYAALPVARELRTAWLQNLAQRQDWAALIRNWNADAANADLRCQYLLARIKTGQGDALRDEGLKLWMTGQKLPQTCTPAFDWMDQQGWFTPALREQRARLALAAGNADLAEFLAQPLPPEQAAPLLRWARLIRAPQDELTLLVKNPRAPVEPPALLDGYTRLAKSDPDAALKLYEPLLRARRLRHDDAAIPYAVALALGLSLSRRSEALTYFRKVPERLADEKIFEWRARSAIWNGQWRLAQSWIEHMPKPLREQDRWVYWRARMLAQHAAGEAEAKKLFASLSAQNGYFPLLAAWRLQRDYEPHPQPVAPDPAIWKQLSANDALIRARELHRAGQDAWATAEWRGAMRDLPPDARIQAGLLASSWDWPAQAIPALASAAAFDDFDVTYPLPYDKAVNDAAALSGLPPAWIYGVLRQESLYDAQAVSRANAYGLLQLLLPTAREVARRWKQPTPSIDDLFRPEINVPLGAAYL
ncbi:MAG: transglycosylase SLT domain-containing protein, partial [Stenotrophobium sp.]